VKVGFIGNRDEAHMEKGVVGRRGGEGREKQNEGRMRECASVWENCRSEGWNSTTVVTRPSEAAFTKV